MLLILLGMTAGAVTTITGFGGGMILVVALALLETPLYALTVTALALCLGNGHRLLLFRRHIQWRLAGPLLAGILPGALLGASLAVSIPETALHICIFAMAALALARAALIPRWRLSRRVVGPAGLGIGVVAATSGGAGFIMGPLLLSTGLSGGAYIATMATGAVAMHLGRLGGYGLSGALDTGTVLSAALLSLALMLGNWAGVWLRAQLSRGALARLEYAAPVLCATLAAIGLV